MIALMAALLFAMSIAAEANNEPRFHVSTHMAYNDTSAVENHSWWCGSDVYDQGGYGNEWREFLELPPVDVASSSYPIIAFVFRIDTEPDHDFVYVQAESNGVYVNLNRKGYSGRSDWDSGTDAYSLWPCDKPLKIRFLFESDYSKSDEDGLYHSVGGAFMVDEIQVYDYPTGEVYFFDDCEDGGRCFPGKKEVRVWGSIKAMYR